MFAFKSSVTERFDYRQIDLSQIAEPFRPDPEKLEHDLLMIRKKHANMCEVQQVETDDFVTLTCTSANKKFNKENITVRVDRGLFSRDLERQLLAMKPSERKEISVDGSPVSVFIHKITRSVLPPLTDETVAGWNIDGTTTAAGLRQAVLDKERQEYVSDMAESIALYVLTEAKRRSSFILDDAEVAEARASGEKMARDMMASVDFDLDTATDEEVKQVFGRTKQEHFDFVTDIWVDNLKSSVAGASLMQENHVDITDEEYQNALAEYMGSSDAPEDEARKAFSFDTFVKEETANYYLDQIEIYVKKYLETKCKL